MRRGQQTFPLSQFFPLRGGLDQQTPAIAIPPGRAIGVLNHESTPLGYQRTEGCERFDGQPAPSAAAFYTLTFTTGTQTFAAGQSITGLISGATARVLDIPVLSSGTFIGGDAAGTLPVHLVEGAFVAGEGLQVGGVTFALLGTAPSIGDWREGDSELGWLVAAQGYARGLIQAVPGAGPIRGLIYYGGKLNVWRDNGAAAVLYHSTANGWAATDLGDQLYFNTAGPYEIVVGDVITGDQSAATATVRYVGFDQGDWSTSDAKGILILDNVTGTFGDETLSVGAHLAVASVAASQTPVTFPAGGRYEFDIFNFYATSSFERCYGANGVSQAFDFDGDSVAFISTGMDSIGLADTPTSVHQHKSHLFLTFDAGSLQHSSLGLPRNFSGIIGAAELGLGHAITGVIPNNAASMLIFTETSASQLTGNDSSDWLLEPIAEKDAGAKPFTAQKIGDVIYLDNRGIRNAQSTATFANFKLGTFTSLIDKELARKRDSGAKPVASCVVKAKDQYLLFYDDASGISLWFGAKQPEAMLFEYPFTVSCTPHVVEIDGKERVFVGAEDGFVYELNKGTSFDGAVVDAYFQLPFAHQGAPRLLKRYQGLDIEVTGEVGTKIGLIANFNGGDSEQPFAQNDSLTVEGGGGLWGVADWGEFVWSSPLIGRAHFWIDGMGSDMGPIFVSQQNMVSSYTISGVTTVFSPRGAKR